MNLSYIKYLGSDFPLRLEGESYLNLLEVDEPNKKET